MPVDKSRNPRQQRHDIAVDATAYGKLNPLFLNPHPMPDNRRKFEAASGCTKSQRGRCADAAAPFPGSGEFLLVAAADGIRRPDPQNRIWILMKVNMKSLVKPEMCSVQHRLELALHNILRDYNQIAPVHKQGRAAGYRKVTVRKSKLFNNFRRKITAQRIMPPVSSILPIKSQPSCRMSSTKSV